DEAQGPGGGSCALDGASPRQGRDPFALSQYRLLRRQRLWRRRRRETLLRQDCEGVVTERGGDAGGTRALAFGACAHAPSRERAAASGPGAQGNGRNRRDLP